MNMHQSLPMSLLSYPSKTPLWVPKGSNRVALRSEMSTDVFPTSGFNFKHFAASKHLYQHGYCGLPRHIVVLNHLYQQHSDGLP
jgi:hypothetical protein